MSIAVLAALGIAAAGLLVQFAAEPAKFGVFPLGIVFIAVAAVLTRLTARWRLAPLPAVLISGWITFGGLVRGELTANLSSPNLLTVLGNVVMEIGLVGAVVIGIVGMTTSKAAGCHLDSNSGPDSRA